MNNNLLQAIEKLEAVELQALVSLIDIVKEIAQEATNTANEAMSISNNMIVGTPDTALNKDFQTVNFKTLFGQDPAARGRFISFIYGTKSFLGYANDATGSFYQDADFSDTVQNLAEIEVVNRRTMLNALRNISQNVGIGFLNKLEDDETSDGVTTRFSKVVFKGNGYKIFYKSTAAAEEDPSHELVNYASLIPLVNKSWKSKKIAIGSDLSGIAAHSVYTTTKEDILNQVDGGYLVKVLKLNGHAAYDTSDPSFLEFYSNNEILGIPGATLPLVQLPNPIEYELYLEYTVTGAATSYMYTGTDTSKTVLVPVKDTVYTAFVDSDGDLSLLIKSDLTESVAFDNTAINVDYLTATHNPGFYLVVKKWSLN